MACLLIVSGIDPESAFQHISVVRECVVSEIVEQQEWVVTFARELQETSLNSGSV
jgi:hypothetical protein